MTDQSSNDTMGLILKQKKLTKRFGGISERRKAWQSLQSSLERLAKAYQGSGVLTHEEIDAANLLLKGIEERIQVLQHAEMETYDQLEDVNAKLRIRLED